ncbi:unnamed protein product [Cladocopium goreaui]|uniref:Phosphatidic acid phosphatase type 2/haloperoxidase domain-containing protein n=1 Tax=Cladocopium goreaui TaxID=2562237 RepID=A0A9P1G572_9DINO|nr:unnamed protein product [Cladocopium goreaui]
MREECIPWWYNATVGFEGCPYGRRLPGDVTLPNDARFIDWVAVVYSYIPFVVPVLVFAELLCTRGTRQLSVLLFTGMTTLMNELLVKPFFATARPGAFGPAPGALTDSFGQPAGSCNTTCGMPSSHSTMAIGFLMLTMFDGIIRLKPDSNVLTQDKDEVEMQQRLKEMISVTPLAPKRVMSNTEFLGFYFTWQLLLGPVPLMRVVLHDHTAAQVCLGGMLGAVYAVLWFRFTIYMINRYKHKVGHRFFCGLLKHNYAPVAMRVMARPSGQDGTWQELQWDAKIEEVEAENVETGAASSEVCSSER